MNLLKWSLLSGVEDVQNRLESIFWKLPGDSMRECSLEGDWIPQIKISETEAAYLIKAKIPEVKSEDVRVTIQNGMLTIEGERRLAMKLKGKSSDYTHANDNFVEHFRMPANSDTSRVETEFKDGMMKITLPKRVLPTLITPPSG